MEITNMILGELEMAEEEIVVMKLCIIGDEHRQLGISSRCKLYYPVLTNVGIDEKLAESPDFNYIEYAIDSYRDEIHGDDSLHWICNNCNLESASNI